MFFLQENISEFIYDFQVIIKKCLLSCKEFNYITRIIVSIFFIILSIDTFTSLIFLLFCFIFIVYYIKKKLDINKMIKSPIFTVSNSNINSNMNSVDNSYTNLRSINASNLMSPMNSVNLNTLNSNIKNFYNYSPSNDKPAQLARSIINNNFKKNSNFYCDDEVSIDPENYVSKNQALAGGPNPKTLIAPVVVPPPMDLQHWRANNLINHSHINTASQIDTYLSGYAVSNCCDNINTCLVDPRGHNTLIENYENPYEYEGISDKCRPVRKIPQLPSCTPIQSPRVAMSNNNFVEHFELPYDKNLTNPTVRINQNGLVNTECGYNPNQLKYNLPSNLSVGNCERQNEFTDYNNNLFTQNIQPDIFTKSEIIEPINSNIGISFTQQFKPTTYSIDEKGLTFTEHDPLLYNPPQSGQPMGITESDVYDPRFYGYGTSYRSYTDELTGQTRFYYDDINSIRMPNYVSRSNIDFAKYADTYGPLNNSNKYGNPNNSEIRALANDSFLTSSLQHRTELQERLLRKRNNEMWQLRKYPVRN